MVRLLVSYMEQQSGPGGTALPAPRPDAVIKNEKLRADEYLRLYREIGEPVQWDDRLRMSPDSLKKFLEDRAAQFFVLYLGSARAGLCESYRHAQGDVEITNFGLIPSVQGQKLGPFLLDNALRALWAQKPRHVWLRTDTNDHPNAMKTYERAGFRTYRRQWQAFPD